MKIKPLLHILSIFTFYLGVFMLVPIGFSLYYGDNDIVVLGQALAIIWVFSIIVFFATRGPVELQLRESFAVVAMAWIIFGIFGALPFYLYHLNFNHIEFTLTNAIFESLSGFTTTGASILNDIEALPRGLLLWRSLTQWIGGMGIIVLSLAILPLIGVGGMQLYRAEVPGPSKDKLKPRIKETAKILWGVYVIISAAETVLLMVGGMSLFDALCHTFTTMATGGFSTSNASIAGFNSIYIEVVITVFMFLAGVNFSLHFMGLKGNIKAYFKNREFVWYLGIMVTVCLLFTINLAMRNYGGPGRCIRHATFQVVSIMTTTGYVTADYEQWSAFARFGLIILMFIGGCGGSTGGGMKVMRVQLLLKHAFREMKKLIHPHAVFNVRVDRVSVSENIVHNVTGFFVLFMFLFVLATLIMSLVGLDLVSAIGAVAASLGNIGPGLGSVGPMCNYAHLPVLGKWVLIFCMLLGRLEIYTIILLFIPEVWRK
jgi:trk system potassium uptake protein TrkH